LMTVVAVADAHVATRHHRGNGVLVDHLADLVAQEHHELVERLDRPLQLDARRFLHRASAFGHASDIAPADGPIKSRTAAFARSSSAGRSGSTIRASYSLRSQVIWRFANWRVAKMARSRNRAASIRPSRCSQACR